MKTVRSTFRFKGGVHPDYNKELARGKAVETMPCPAELVISMSQHLGAPATCVVAVGDYVVKGQLLGERNGFISVPVHAPANGRITAIEPRPGPSGARVPAVILDTTAPVPEGLTPNLKPETSNLKPLDWRSARREDLLARIDAAGICGMGGAGFPTCVKLCPPPGKHCDYLIVNGAECEPYLCADFRLMLEHADRVRTGVEILRKILGGCAVRLAVEANKPEAVAALEKAFADIDGDVEIVVLPVLYPQGSEKHQIYATVGRVVPEPPALPIDVGAHAVRAGDAVREPKNVEAPLGTKYADLVAFCGGVKEPPAKVVSGGTMMGFAVPGLEIATTKTTSGLLLLSRRRVFQYVSQPCINCGRCVRACPMNLNPALIGRAVEADDLACAARAHVAVCIECGACTFVCPAYRPLTQLCRRAKAALRKKP